MTSSNTSQSSVMKVVVVGDCGVGKTSIINSFAGNQFSDQYLHTVAVDYNCRSVVLNNTLINLNILDTSGERTFPDMTHDCYQKADGFIFVYDVTELNSLEGLRSWLKEVDNYARCQGLPRLLLGNKSDLRDKKVVSEASAKEFGIPEGMHHFEVSACTNRNIEAAFCALAADLRRHKQLGGIVPIGSKPMQTQNHHKHYSYNHVVEFNNCPTTVPDYIRQLKILVIGASRVGKTALVNRFLHNDFEPQYQPTIRLEFNQKRVDIAKRSVKVHILDTAGDDQFEDTRRSYYKGANAYVIVYDVTNKQSFRSADRLLQELKEFKISDEIPRILVGNKCDLDRKKVVNTDTARVFAELKAIPLIETSCKMGVQIDTCFARLICAMLQRPTLWRNALNNHE